MAPAGSMGFGQQLLTPTSKWPSVVTSVETRLQLREDHGPRHGPLAATQPIDTSMFFSYKNLYLAPKKGKQLKTPSGLSDILI